MAKSKVKHCAKFSDSIISALLEETLDLKGLLLDPFAGTGKVHLLNRPDLRTVGIELEPEWAEMHPNSIVGNALHLPFGDWSFDVIATSPTYGNRTADAHNAKDGSKRNTYTHTLGRKLHDDNSGKMQWGPKYRDFHSKAWAEATRVLKPEGTLLLNMSNHIRKGKEVPVTEWHIETLEKLGYKLVESRPIATPRNRYGSNHHLRCEFEFLLRFCLR